MMGIGNLSKDKVKLQLKAIDEVTLEANGKKVTMSGDDFHKAAQGKLPGQLEFEFHAVFSDMEIKEAIRGVKALTKEIIRLGGNERIAKSTLELLSIGNEIIYAAVNAIEESLAD